MHRANSYEFNDFNELKLHREQLIFQV